MRSPRLHVAFVCSFNRARSVMAAALFAEQLRERGLGNVVAVSSAGTFALSPSAGSFGAENAANYSVPAESNE